MSVEAILKSRGSSSTPGSDAQKIKKLRASSFAEALCRTVSLCAKPGLSHSLPRVPDTVLTVFNCSLSSPFSLCVRVLLVMSEKEKRYLALVHSLFLHR